MNKTYHIHTFGCQMNVADSGHVAAQLEALGYQPVLKPDGADVIVINTCVVRQSAEDKAVGKLGALLPLKRRNPDTVISLMGCMVGVKPNPVLAERFPWVDVFMPPSEPGPLMGFLMERDLASESRAIDEASVLARYAAQDGDLAEAGHDQLALVASPKELPGRAGSVLQSVRHLTQNGETPISAHVPIVYGCSHACTFCIIPFRRGIERSRPLQEIVAEIEDLVAQGVREVTLLGQIVDRYGYDLPGRRPDLADLLHAVHAIDGLWRIRFLTSHPNYMDDRILHAVRDLPKVCEHIEVPIQAGDDQVLENMRRGYTSDDYRRLVAHIRSTIPNASIHTDIIVGFPGETDAQFRRTYDVLAELKLDKAHLARYSPRPGTVSERRMVDDVAEEAKVERHHALEELQAVVQNEINRRFVGETVEVLVEDLHKGKWRGRTRQNKLVFFSDQENWRGKLADVFITWAGPYSMQGRLSNQRPGVTSPSITLMPFEEEVTTV
ncbi:MAG: MiaB/RimO family radical SAM methylthiotransferase [Anaerolineae bacterium]|nr:MiaB/RimO family radical SAM methylthiotransferase [Anaerolineae bacterium]MCB9130688.1 MiaB/RimO family radical SAM methylthiotransferase [Anaerolineales bacterium]MCB0228567.1 MiaB/RimO family radical SAM methylthiotransferase [Anaerolineae bacterium]MCB0235654.1 MiaB/RimO family radical SAM methylthiotransferase [Anaerolineae bacterium]MCB0248645.1 MiaB/RimO family radical SAM methylthiotransferase [Anaerolineae bacterium]